MNPTDRDRCASAVNASTGDVTMESVMAAMEKFRVVQSEFVKPGTVFLINPSDYLTMKPMAMDFKIQPLPKSDYIATERFVRDSLLDSLRVPTHILYPPDWSDWVSEKPKPPLRVSILLAVLAAIIAFLLEIL